MANRFSINQIKTKLELYQYRNMLHQDQEPNLRHLQCFLKTRAIQSPVSRKANIN